MYLIMEAPSLYGLTKVSSTVLQKTINVMVLRKFSKILEKFF